MRDALLLAIRNWPWLVFLPLLIAATITGIYQAIPSTYSATATLNTDLAAVQLAIERMNLAERADLSLRYDQETLGYDQEALGYDQETPSSEIVVTAQAPEQGIALRAVEELIGLIPPNLPAVSMLARDKLLELRAQRQYLKFLQGRLSDRETMDEIGMNFLAQEIELVNRRIAWLGRFGRPAKAVPVVEKGATVVPTRFPPTQNVLVFSYLAVLFTTWIIIYGLEQRRSADERLARSSPAVAG
jgi:hypothetical protein